MEVILKNLSKVFPGRKGRAATVAVDNMSLVIPDGKLVGLLGPSGCGKSTTLYMVAGLHKPNDGEIIFAGNDPVTGEKVETNVTGVPPEKRGIGLVFQNYALYPHLSVRQNIMFPLENIRPKLSKEKKYAIAKEMAELVDIAQYLDRKPKELSGGQQQRVAIARALAKKPQVLLLDEPLSNLDARLRLQTREEIKRIQKETGVTTIFVTHDQEEAMSISDEIVVMSKGIIQQVGEPQKVYDEPANLFVAKFLGSPAINILDGEIKNGKLLINGKVFATGPEYAGNGDLDNFEIEPVYEEVVKLGFAGSIEEYRDQIIHNFVADAPISETETSEPEVVVKKPFKKAQKAQALDEIELMRRLRAKGLNFADSQLETAFEKIRFELKSNRMVKIGVRPENFIPDPKGVIPADVAYIEHIGRDISIIGNVVNQLKSKLRIIISSELSDAVKPGVLSFSVKKFYVFEKSGLRIK